MERYYPYCITVAFRILHERDEAHDAAAKLFEKIRGKSVPTDPLHERRWIAKAIKRIATDRYRVMAHRTQIGASRLDKRIYLDQIPEPVQVETEPEDHTGLSRALSRLSMEDRALIAHQYFYGGRARVMGLRTGMSEKRVYAKTRTAIDRLRRML